MATSGDPTPGDAHFKALLQERIHATGERYAAARANVIAEHGEAARRALRLGDVHDQTSALREVLDAAGVCVPHTESTPDEALLLGLGGGIGAAVFAFHYAGHLPHLYVETRCHTQYAYNADFICRAATGLGLAFAVHESGAAKKSRAALDHALAGGAPCIAFVDILSMPHNAGKRQGGAVPWAIVAHEANERVVRFTDRSDAVLELVRVDFEAARNAYKKGKNRLLTLQQPTERAVSLHTLQAGVRSGVAYCAAELSGQSAKKGFANNFGLAALNKWAKEIGAGGKKGWRQTFAPGPPLAAGVRQLYHWIETAGTGGAGFRRMYADFLRQAATICDDSAYLEVAVLYESLAEQWTALAMTPLQSAPALQEIQHALDSRASLVHRGAPAGDLLALDERLDDLVASCDPYPADAETVYEQLEAGVHALHASELRAAQALAELSRSERR